MGQSTFTAIVRRDLLVAYRRRGEAANPLVFFTIVCTLFPLGLGPDPKQLALLAPGILWVVALLACLLSTDSLFRTDYDDGCLEQMLLNPSPLYIQVLAKACTHWFLTGLPLTLVSPLLAVVLQMPADGMLALVASLGLGTIVLSLVGAIGAALTVGLRRGGLLLSLIVLPLYIPVLIFGSSAVQAGVNGFDYSGQLAVLGAFVALSLTLAPLAISASLKISVDN